MMPTREHSPVMTILLKHLAAGQKMTARSLATLTGISERNAKRYIDLALELDKAHIVDWVRHGSRGRYVPEIANGPGEDAPHPTL